MSYYGSLNKDYLIRFGAHVATTSLTVDDYVRNFPNKTAAATWAVEQQQIVKHGAVLRTGLDKQVRAIGQMSDIWTFALWTDQMYWWLLTTTGGLYDLDCTIQTYDRSIAAHAQPYFWGRVHIPLPNELVPLGNRYYQRPTLKFYELEYVT